MITRRIVFRFVICLAIFLFLALSAWCPLPASTLWQSELPTPDMPTPGNPYWLRADAGGRIYCGLQQSSVWLDVPPGFTSANGAEFRCDPTSRAETFDKQGYLIGFWPTTIPILEPLVLVFELDPLQVPKDCDDCLAGRYYEGTTKKWHNLPTTYKPAIVAAHIQIDRYLPSSGYQEYLDRFLVALFQIAPTPKASPTSKASPTPKTSPTPRPSSSPSTTETATPTSSPSPSPTDTVAASRSPVPPPSPTTPVTAPVVSSSEPVPTAPPTSVSFSSESSESSDSGLLVVLLVLIVLIIVVLLVFILVIRKQRRLQKR